MESRGPAARQTAVGGPGQWPGVVAPACIPSDGNRDKRTDPQPLTLARSSGVIPSLHPSLQFSPRQGFSIPGMRGCTGALPREMLSARLVAVLSSLTSASVPNPRPHSLLSAPPIHIPLPPISIPLSFRARTIFTQLSPSAQHWCCCLSSWLWKLSTWRLIWGEESKRISMIVWEMTIP